MKIIKRGMLELPKEALAYLDYKQYVYQKKSLRPEFVKNMFITKDKILIPRNPIKFLKAWRGSKDFKIIDETIVNEIQRDVKTINGFELRDYQKEPMQKIVELFKNGKNDVMLVAGTGYGKTVTLSWLLTQMKQVTTIIVDLTMLADQMYNEISKFSNLDIQIVNGKTIEVKEVNIVTTQLLNKRPDILQMLQKVTGLVVLDEAQISGAETIKNILQSFPARYRLGLSATPSRSDGLDGILEDVFTYKVVAKVSNMKVEVHMVEDYENLISASSYKEAINNTIKRKYIPFLDVLLEKLVKVKNKSVMIAVDSKEIQEELAKRYAKYGTAILNSNTKKEQREQILKDYENEKIKILIGYKVLSKGISIPRMEVLINLFAATTKENIEQLIGRLMREHDKKKKAIFIDFTFGLSLHKQYNVKINTYKKLIKENKIDWKRISLDNYKKVVSKIK